MFYASNGGRYVRQKGGELLRFSASFLAHSRMFPPLSPLNAEPTVIGLPTHHKSGVPSSPPPCSAPVAALPLSSRLRRVVWAAPPSASSSGGGFPCAACRRRRCVKCASPPSGRSLRAALATAGAVRAALRLTPPAARFAPAAVGATRLRFARRSRGGRRCAASPLGLPPPRGSFPSRFAIPPVFVAFFYRLKPILEMI